ncbi:MAG TPA: metallophosphoesterase [Nitrososphaeraceae archaeon]
MLKIANESFQLRKIYSLFRVVLLFLIFLCYPPNVYVIENSVNSYGEISSSGKDIHFAAAGDWGCNPTAQRTVNLIKNKNPDLLLALGDFSYQKDTGCWFKIMSPLINKSKIVIGEHDFDTNDAKRLQDYVGKFNLTDPYYSFNYGNVHFLAMSSVIPFKNQTIPYRLLHDESRQHDFVSNDLYTASQNKSINWIVVYLYKPMYTSPTQHPSQTSLRDLYHLLFDYYGVDLVLQAHNHNYQRSYPLRFNQTNSSLPIITDRYDTAYDNPNGTIFAVVGTGGAIPYHLLGKSPYIVTQFQNFGFLNIDIVENGTKLIGSFYDSRDGTIKDHFTIIKN